MSTTNAAAAMTSTAPSGKRGSPNQLHALLLALRRGSTPTLLTRPLACRLRPVEAAQPALEFFSVPIAHQEARQPVGVAAPHHLPRRVGARFAQPEFSCKRDGLPPDVPRAAIRIGEAFNFPVENPLEHLRAWPPL